MTADRLVVRTAGNLSIRAGDLLAVTPAGHCALWIHVPDNEDADRASRCLADHQVLHFRHYRPRQPERSHIR
jgi:hypothetical protein